MKPRRGLPLARPPSRIIRPSAYTQVGHSTPAAAASPYGRELITVRLHDRSGHDAGKIELPSGWAIEPGDLLAADDGRLICVARVIVCEPGSARRGAR
jgi:hypothetical protein